MPLQRHSSHSGSGWLLAPTASMPPPPPPSCQRAWRRVRLPAMQLCTAVGMAWLWAAVGGAWLFF